MALRFPIEIPGGYTADYWRISSISQDFMANTTYIKLQLSKDKAARDEGKYLNDAYGYTLNGLFSTRSKCYDELKLQVALFMGASDILE